VASQTPFDPKTFLTSAGSGRTLIDARRNQTIYAQGDNADAVFYLQKGSVKLTVQSEQGKDAVVTILRAGCFFGEGCLTGKQHRQSSTVALEHSLITAIPRETMVALLREQPAFNEVFTCYLLSRNSRIEEDLIDQLFNSSEKRLARLLLLLADGDAPDQPKRVRPPLSQETLADMIGTTRSRVSYFMNKFRKLGLITYNGRIDVNDERLTAYLRNGPLRDPPGHRAIGIHQSGRPPD
jgi:CRP-like cAMP-binding protein